MQPADHSFSDFCFLGKYSTRKLGEIIDAMNGIDEKYRAHHINGQRAIRDLVAERIEAPVHDPDEPDTVYDTKMRVFARQVVANAEARIKQHWENCMTLSDRLLEYGYTQQDVAHLMGVAAMQKDIAPGDIPLMTTQRRDLMNGLYADMKRLQAVPLLAVYQNHSPQLEAMAEDLKAIKNRHSAMLEQIADMSGNRISEMLDRTVMPAAICMLRLEECEAGMVQCLEQVPELRNAQILTRPSPSGQRRGR